MFFKALLRIIVALALAAIILGISSMLAMTLSEALNLPESSDLSGAFIGHTTMLILSVLIIAILSKGKLALYGFKLPESPAYGKIITLGLAGGILSTLIGTLLPGEESSLFADKSFIQIVVFMWIWASICEEVLMRGLIQGYLHPLARKGLTVSNLRISLPVLVAAFIFALIHLNPVILAMGAFRTVNIVCFAFILGLIAGYYRERTGSLIPAIAVHALFNVGGTLTGYFL